MDAGEERVVFGAMEAAAPWSSVSVTGWLRARTNEDLLFPLV